MLISLSFIKGIPNLNACFSWWDMHGKKRTGQKIYDTYSPYPVSFDFKENGYCSENPENVRPHSTEGSISDFLQDFDDSVFDHEPHNPSQQKPTPSNDERGMRPLRLLNSLFADRLNFLQNALDELEEAKNEREQLIRYALDELDPEIRECEVSLSALKAALNHTERRRNLERRREALLSWRDLTWLKSEIRKLHREIDALTSTTGTAENRKAPT